MRQGRTDSLRSLQLPATMAQGQFSTFLLAADLADTRRGLLGAYGRTPSSVILCRYEFFPGTVWHGSCHMDRRRKRQLVDRISFQREIAIAPSVSGGQRVKATG